MLAGTEIQIEVVVVVVVFGGGGEEEAGGCTPTLQDQHQHDLALGLVAMSALLMFHLLRGVEF